MSLALAVSIKNRLMAEATRSGSALATWQTAQSQTIVPVVGYSRPTSAAGWPFLSVNPTVDRRDLRTGRGDLAEVTLVAGYRLAKVGKDNDAGLVAVDELANAALTALQLPWVVTWAGYDWDARTAERIFAEAEHPVYEVEILVRMGRVGVD